MPKCTCGEVIPMGSACGCTSCPKCGNRLTCNGNIFPRIPPMVAIEPLIYRLKDKLAETTREKNRVQLNYDKSSDYHTPPSHCVTALRGQETALQWCIEELEKLCK